MITVCLIHDPADQGAGRCVIGLLKGNPLCQCLRVGNVGRGSRTIVPDRPGDAIALGHGKRCSRIEPAVHAGIANHVLNGARQSVGHEIGVNWAGGEHECEGENDKEANGGTSLSSGVKENGVGLATGGNSW